MINTRRSYTYEKSWQKTFSCNFFHCEAEEEKERQQGYADEPEAELTILDVADDA